MGKMVVGRGRAWLGGGILRALAAGTVLLMLFVLCSVSAPNAAGSGPDAKGRCQSPDLVRGAPGDAGDDAAGTGQIFEQIGIWGLTDRRIVAGTGGVATADLNRDGRRDFFVVEEEGEFPGSLRLYLNQGCWRFKQVKPILKGLGDTPFANHAIPVFADFNGDRRLDFYLTGDPYLDGKPHPNLLFLATDDFRTFREVGRRLGVGDDLGYSRQSAIADVNGDGYLDIGVGADQIGDRHYRPGLPWQRLYVYKPAKNSNRFVDGHFVDIGGTDRIPGFGGKPTDNPSKDRSSPTIMLRDIDEDGDIDVVQSYHIDTVLSKWDSPTLNDERRHGVYVWKNQLAQTGKFRFRRVKPGTGGLAESGWSKYDPAAGRYVPQKHAVSHPYLSSADVDNDDDLDILTAGSTDLYWHVHTDDIAAKFWINRGKKGFKPALDRAGLGSLDWTYDQWMTFYGAPALPAVEQQLITSCELSSNQLQLCLDKSLGESKMYHADSLWADFNNDGWVDLFEVDRHEFVSGYGQFRNALYLNRGDGTFKPVKTEIAGIDENGIAAEAVDLNRDGLLEIYLMKDLGNTAPNSQGAPYVPESEYTDSIFWNTGRHGGRKNHWLVVRPTGLPDRRLIGSKIRIYSRRGRLLGRRDLFPVTSYKTSVELESHFGLGSHRRVVVAIERPDGRIFRRGVSNVDRVLEFGVKGRVP